MTLTISTYNRFWKLGKEEQVELITLPPRLTIDIPRYEIYDELLALRRQAREQQDWERADALRDYAELTWGLTVVDGKEEYPYGYHDFQHFSSIRYTAWYKKWWPYLGSTALYKDVSPEDRSNFIFRNCPANRIKIHYWYF